jgi:hypothetical protein
MKVTSDIEKTGYYIIPGAEDVNNIGNETIQYLIDRKDNGRIIMNPGKDNYHVKLMVEDMSKYIKYSFSNPGRTFSFVDTYNEATDFSIVEGEKESTIRFRLQDNGTDYFMTYENKVGTGRVLAMKSYDEVENDEYYGYDLNFLTVSGNVDCEYEWVVADENDETYLSTGKRDYIFKVTRPQSGDGKKCMDTDGITELTYTDKQIVERLENVNCELSLDNNWSGCSATCGGGIEKAEINIDQRGFNNGRTCDIAKNLLNIESGATIKGNENDGYYREKSCNTQSCITCKVRDTFVDDAWKSNYYGYSSKDDIRTGLLSACGTLTNENDCTAGNFNDWPVEYITGFVSHWKNVCQWK